MIKHKLSTSYSNEETHDDGIQSNSEFSAQEPNYIPTTSLLTPNFNASAIGEINIRNTEMEFSQNTMPRGSFYQRTFRKLEKGSLRGSIFALCASAIGSGVLSLPYVLRLNGWVLGTLFILVGAFAACWSLFMIAESAIKANVKNFSKLTNNVGGKALELFLQINIILFLAGSCISYQIIISELVASLLQKCGIHDGPNDDFLQGWQFRVMQCGPTALFILFPLSLIRDMSGFRHISVFSIFALIYTGIVLFVELPSYSRYASEHREQFRIEYALFDWNFFTGASITFFAYTCHTQLLQIYSELVNPNQQRIKKIISRSIFVDFLFYISIALAGYFSSYNQTPKIVLERESLTGGINYAFLIAQISIIFVLFVAVPVAYNPLRNQIFYLFFKKERFSHKENIICTFSFIALTCFFAIAYPNISDVLGIVGGLNATSIQFLVPMICSVKVNGLPWTAPINLIKIGFFGILCLIGYINVGTTIYKLVTHQEVI